MTVPSVFYHWPSGRRLYCRPCNRLTVHDVASDERYVECQSCHTLVLGAQVVSLYSDDKYAVTPRILLPLPLRAPHEINDIIARILHWSPRLGVVGSYLPDEDTDPMAGLDELLAELGG